VEGLVQHLLLATTAATVRLRPLALPSALTRSYRPSYLQQLWSFAPSAARGRGRSSKEGDEARRRRADWRRRLNRESGLEASRRAVAASSRHPRAGGRSRRLVQAERKEEGAESCGAPIRLGFSPRSQFIWTR
jgi:hypothetical protein